MPRKSTNISSWADWYCQKYLPSVKRFSLQLKRRFPEKTEECEAILSLYAKREARIIEFHRDTMRRAGKSWWEIRMKLTQKGFPKALISKAIHGEQDLQSEDADIILRAVDRKLKAKTARGYARHATLKQLASEYSEYAEVIYERFGEEGTESFDDLLQTIRSKYPPPHDDKQRARITRYLMSRGYGWDDISQCLKRLI